MTVSSAPGAVAERGEGLGVLGLEAGIEQLLLGVINDVAVLVHEEAVASLTDTDVVDIARDAGEAQIQREPGGLAPGIEPRRHRDHPGIVALEDGLDVRRGEVGVP